MNACRVTRFPEVSKAVRCLLPAASLAASALCSAAAPGDAQDPGAFKTEVSHAALTTMPAYTVEEAPSTKTHTLFMGADIAINLDRDTYKVKDVFGSNWVIDINGQQREISAKQAPVNLKITPNLKLTETSATIVGFKKVQSYSFENDPSVRLTRGMSQSASMNNDLLAVAANATARIDSLGNKEFAQFAASDDQFSSNAQMTTAQYAFSNSHAAGSAGRAGPLSSPVAPSTGAANPLGGTDINFAAVANSAAAAQVQTTNGNEPVGQIASAGFDALDVDFDIRAAKQLHNPYVVTMAKFRTRGAKPGMIQNLVYAEALHPIDEHQSHIHFSEKGFPLGYELVDFQLHIYNRGEEVATNIAADRVELTREEAFEYVKMEYVGAHLKDTLPATPAMGRLPADLPAKLAQGMYGGVFYARVSAEGLADEAYSDAACTKRIDDPYLDSVVKRIRFKPALNNGKPVQGVAALRLGQLEISLG
jgi:hypothetical protein